MRMIFGTSAAQAIPHAADASIGFPLAIFFCAAGFCAAVGLMIAFFGRRERMKRRGALRVPATRATPAGNALPDGMPDGMHAVAALNRMADGLDRTQPGQALELRWLAACGGVQELPARIRFTDQGEA